MPPATPTSHISSANFGSSAVSHPNDLSNVRRHTPIYTPIQYNVSFILSLIVAVKLLCIETEHLILRSWKPEDLPPFIAMNEDERVMRYFPALLSEAETMAFYNRIQDEFDSMGWGLYAVEIKSAGEFIGYVGLHEIGFEADFTPGIEIGRRLSADYHNQGYATEAAKAVLKLAKEFNLGRLYSFTAKSNVPSERVMKKIGMVKIGEFLHPKLSVDSPLCVHVLYKVDL